MSQMRRWRRLSPVPPDPPEPSGRASVPNTESIIQSAGTPLVSLIAKSFVLSLGPNALLSTFEAPFVVVVVLVLRLLSCDRLCRS